MEDKTIYIIANTLDNCEDWTFEEDQILEEEVVKTLEKIIPEVSKDQILLLLKKYFEISPIERLNLNTQDFVQEFFDKIN